MNRSIVFAPHLQYRASATLSTLSLLALCNVSTPAHAQDLTGNQILTVGSGQSYGIITAHDSSTLNLLSGGTIAGAIGLDSSTLNISGGTLQSLTGQGANVTVNVSGGNFGNGLVDIEQANSTTISGGTMRLFTLGVGNASISGGNFTSTLETLLSGFATLSGSNFSLLNSNAGSIDTTNFLFVGTYFTISATLTNNSAIGTYQLFDATYRTVKSTGVNQLENGGFIFSDTSTHNNIILNANAPEPDAVLLFTMGVPALSVLTIRRGRRE